MLLSSLQAHVNSRLGDEKPLETPVVEQVTEINPGVDQQPPETPFAEIPEHGHRADQQVQSPEHVPGADQQGLHSSDAMEGLQQHPKVPQSAPSRVIDNLKMLPLHNANDKS